jgi:phytoene/squalene synthetase
MLQPIPEAFRRRTVESDRRAGALVAKVSRDWWYSASLFHQKARKVLWFPYLKIGISNALSLA